jgi:four helix bundle protein
MRPHKRLDIWEDAMKLTEDIYKITSDFPKEETYGIISQMRKASVSVVSNIAEGCARRGDQEKLQFFTISRGSLSELDAQLEIALRLGFIDKEKYHVIMVRLESVGRMLQGLINSRRRSA